MPMRIVSENGIVDLRSCGLKQLPIRELKKLQPSTLYLSGNQLTTIGKSFVQLSRLVHLNLSDNQLSSLSDNFGSLISLEHLDVHNNLLCHLPVSFAQLRNLKWLNLRGNPLAPSLTAVAGPCETDQECQDCAEKVIRFLEEAYLKLLKYQVQINILEREMAEKAAGKKDQQKNKKGKPNEKKKNQENGIKHLNKQPVQYKTQPNQKKKDKGNKPNAKSHPKKKSGTGKSFIRTTLTRATYVFLLLGFLYIVDFEKFSRIRDAAGYVLNVIVGFLPPALVKTTVDYVRPPLDFTMNALGTVANQTSSFLNTNPLIKDHWSNLREIGSICSARLVDYMRTLYLQLTGYCSDVKNKLFQ